ncbi:winged helix-turn-helix domain-containing protein, partial [Deinococcus sp. 23YEL01]
RVDGEVLNLTPAEFRLLSQLAESPGRAFSREELLAAALPDSDALERVVDAHLASVRRKLDAVQAGGLLHTVRGVGYRLEASP